MNPTRVQIDQAMMAATGHHKAGRLANAEAIYRQVLSHEPKNCEALHLLGVLTAQSGHEKQGIDLILQAIEINPKSANYYANLGEFARKAGESERALWACEQAVALSPDLFMTHSNLGSALRDAGRYEEAAAAHRRSLEIEPTNATGHYRLGNALKSLGRREEAAESMARAVSLNPRHGEAMGTLAGLQNELGRVDEAIATYRLALAVQPDSAMALACLGGLLTKKDRFAEAVELCKQSLRIKPDLPEGLSNLGIALGGVKRREEALAVLEHMVKLHPDIAHGHNNLGVAYKNLNRMEEAVVALRRAVELQPGFTGAWANLCDAYRQLDRWPEAFEAVEHALRQTPDIVDAQINLGICATECRLDEKALAAFKRAIELEPGNPVAHWNFALFLLMTGRFEQGWKEHEWRWKVADLPPYRGFAQPEWDGRALHGKSIVLHAEQGYGDVIQFVRYAPLIAARGGRVILEVPESLVSIMQSIPGVSHVIARGKPLPPFDFHLPMLTAPLVFKTDTESVPLVVPLRIAANKLDQWRAVVVSTPAKMRVGLVWAGRPTHVNDRRRSLHLSQLSPLADDVPGVRFFSLQKGPAAERVSQDWPASVEPLIDFTQDLADFSDTAAVIESLDLVITADTAVAHLAASLGKPTWILLPYVLDWRWLLEGDRTAWYPSVRLFRQKTHGDWPGVIGRVHDELKKLIA